MVTRQQKKEKAREVAADAIRRIVDAAEDLAIVRPILTDDDEKLTVIQGDKLESGD